MAPRPMCFAGTPTRSARPGLPDSHLYGGPRLAHLCLCPPSPLPRRPRPSAPAPTLRGWTGGRAAGRDAGRPGRRKPEASARPGVLHGPPNCNSKVEDPGGVWGAATNAGARPGPLGSMTQAAPFGPPPATRATRPSRRRASPSAQAPVRSSRRVSPARARLADGGSQVPSVTSVERDGAASVPRQALRPD